MTSVFSLNSWLTPLSLGWFRLNCFHVSAGEQSIRRLTPFELPCEGQTFNVGAFRRNVWRCWKAGQTLHEIGRDYDKPHTSIRAVSLHHGGIPLAWLFFPPLSCIGHPNVVYCPLDRIGM
jgi:hypothetical protein